MAIRELRTLVLAPIVAGCVAFGAAATPDDLSTWQAQPLPPDPALAKTATTSGACTMGQDAGAVVQVVLQDRRTAVSAAFLVASPGMSGSCLITSAEGASGGGGRSAPLDPMTTAIVVDEQSTGGLSNSQASLLGGRAAPVVATVTVELSGGATVTASVGNGHWLAWWPNSPTVDHVVARDATGTVLATLDDTTPGWQVK